LTESSTNQAYIQEKIPLWLTDYPIELPVRSSQNDKMYMLKNVCKHLPSSFFPWNATLFFLNLPLKCNFNLPSFIQYRNKISRQSEWVLYEQLWNLRSLTLIFTIKKSKIIANENRTDRNQYDSKKNKDSVRSIWSN
jgi:hypothetical protein